jgi:hypothetical protein
LGTELGIASALLSGRRGRRFVAPVATVDAVDHGEHRVRLCTDIDDRGLVILDVEFAVSLSVSCALNAGGVDAVRERLGALGGRLDAEHLVACVADADRSQSVT